MRQKKILRAELAMVRMTWFESLKPRHQPASGVGCICAGTNLGIGDAKTTEENRGLGAQQLRSQAGPIANTVADGVAPHRAASARFAR